MVRVRMSLVTRARPQKQKRWTWTIQAVKERERQEVYDMRHHSEFSLGNRRIRVEEERRDQLWDTQTVRRLA